jgi:lipoprotein LprG
MSRLRPIVALISALLVLTACTHGKSTTGAGGASGSLPDGAGLLKDSSTAMSDVKTTKFTITSDGTIAGLALHRADGTLTKEGEAQGSAQIDQLGTTVELTFVVKGQTIYIKGPTGGYQALPLSLAATVYDPSAILDPKRGIPKILGSATGAKTEASEDVNGTAAWRVAATMNGGDLATVIPGLSGDVPAKVWVSKADKRLLKATFSVPATGGAKGGTVTVGFSDFDAPVTINAPST